MLRNSGANKVFFGTACPPVLFPGVYGIDMPTYDELIAHGRTEDQVAEKLGADWICFQTEDGLNRAIKSLEGKN